MMTREEAINWLEAYLADYYDAMDIPDDLPYEVAQIALSALRPVSRETGNGADFCAKGLDRRAKSRQCIVIL